MPPPRRGMFIRSMLGRGGRTAGDVVVVVEMEVRRLTSIVLQVEGLARLGGGRDQKHSEYLHTTPLLHDYVTWNAAQY
jgi:hypothetical protein